MIQSVASVAYNYDTTENIEKVQSTEEQVVAVDVQDTSEVVTQFKPLDTAEAIQKTLTESADYSKKIKDKIIASEIVDGDPYLAMAIDLKKTIESLISSVTEQDIKHVFKEHFNPEKMSIEMFAKVIDQNKRAVKNNDFNHIQQDLTVQVEEFKDKYSDEVTIKQVISSLEAQNLPVNPKNMDKIFQVLKKVEEIKTVPNEAIVHVIQQNKSLTIDNIYKARFMSSPPNKENDTLQVLEPQIKQLLKDEELPASKDMIELSKLLIQSDVPLDETTFQKVKIIKNDLNKIESKYVIDKAIYNLANKIPVGDIPVVAVPLEPEVNKPLEKNQLVAILDQIENIEIEDIKRVVMKGQVINLDQLFTSSSQRMERPTEFKESVPLEPNQELKAIQATLNLEEIRLKMTLEAATRLSNKGVHIEVEPLENLVAQLRTLERESYARHLELNEMPVTQDKINQVQEVYEQVNQLRTISSKTVVKVIDGEIDFTIKALSSTSRNELLLENAMKNYEMSRTKPRGDLGDSLEKTFAHLEDTLIEVGVEPTENAIRAAKILARNEMPLTVAHLEAVMLVDNKVRTVTEQMHPNIVVQMIKDQLSPVDLHIDEVIDYMHRYDEKLGISPVETFASAIVGLDQNKEITTSERESLVGIYRMLSTVSKSKGAAVGFLMKNNLPLKLDHLFEAAKYIKKIKGDQPLMEMDIDDGFGLLKEVRYEGKNIKQQIETALQKTTLAPTDEHIALAQVLKEEGIHLEPEYLNKAGLNLHTMDHLLGKATLDIMLALVQKGILKDDMSLSQLVEKLTHVDAAVVDMGQDVLESLNTLKQMDLETLKNFEKYNITKSLNNMVAAQQLSEEPFELSRQLNRIMKALQDQPISLEPLKELMNRSDKGQELSDYGKTLSDLKEQLEQCDLELLSSQGFDKGVIHKAISETTQILDFQKAIHSSDEYYQIPMMLHGKMTQINMYYFGENKGQRSGEGEEITNIHLYFDTEHLGKVQAHIRLDKDSLDFNMCSSQPGDLEFIQSFGQKIKAILSHTDYEINKVQYGFFEGKSPINEAIKEPIKVKEKAHKESKFETTI